MLIEALIETPKGSKKKLELTKTGKLRLDQVLQHGFRFPGNYGFIPGTLGGDGDALDVLVLGRTALKPKTIIKVRPIAIMYMKDSGERDDKIIAVRPRSRKRMLTKSEQEKIAYFFKRYKRRHIEIQGFGGAEKAKKVILQAKRRCKDVL